MAEGYHELHGKLVERFGTKGDALCTFVACLLSIGVSGLAAYVSSDSPRSSVAWVL